jgi:glucokinase
MAGSVSAQLAHKFSSVEFVDLLFQLARKVVPDLNSAAGAALAVPGPFDTEAGVSYMRHKLEGLYGFGLRDALARRFGWEPRQVRFVNDACAFLLGEMHAGAARGAERAIGLVLGTGIGSAFGVNGRCVTDGNAVPPGGEIWDFPYGKTTVEDLLSTRALKQDYAARTGKDIEVSTIAAAADNDPHARQVFETFGRHLGQVIRDVLIPFSPNVVVFGGGISRSSQLFLPAAAQQLNGIRLRLTTSGSLDQAALIGAAAFWNDCNQIVPEPILKSPADNV